MSFLRPSARRTAVVLALLFALTGLALPLEAKDTVTLRVNDAEGPPGGQVSIVVRTYAPRPIRQGQISTGPPPPPSAAVARTLAVDGPFAALEGVTVLSGAGDALATSQFDSTSQSAVAMFSSPSASINVQDGALVIFHLRLRPDLEIDEEFQVRLDPAATYLLEADGAQLPLELRSGRLRIREDD